MKYIHIAGTNGKGSTAAMLAAVLTRSGYKTGLFTSPHIYRFNERMKINGEMISDEDIAQIVQRMYGGQDEDSDDSDPKGTVGY